MMSTLVDAVDSFTVEATTCGSSESDAAINDFDSLVGREQKFYREATKRVFVNRGLNLGKIRFFGFDMDYTLAIYNSPQFEALAFDLIKVRLTELGYSLDIKKYAYDSKFPIRGLWFDSLYGNLLKVDALGNIILCCHGFKFLKKQEILELYPSKFLMLDESRVSVLNTLFDLPQAYILACIIDFYGTRPGNKSELTGIRSGDLFMTYRSILEDIRDATSWVHTRGELKQRTVENLDEYVAKDFRLPLLLTRMRDSGAKVFLLTNSEYWYTEKIMAYIFDLPGQTKKDWKEFFNYIVVDARKPVFFKGGSTLRQVDSETGMLKIGLHTGPLMEGKVYSGGSCESFTELIGAQGMDVLYVGDHIYGDILKSKKIGGWRTFLVVPELRNELHVWTERCSLFAKLENLDTLLGETYKDLDSGTTERSSISKIRAAIKDVTHEINGAYGVLGSLFRSGNQQTFFSSQVVRYADLYGVSFLNLIYYPFSYMFRASAKLMPHESTVFNEHEKLHQDDEDARVTSKSKLFRFPHLAVDLAEAETSEEDDDGGDGESSIHQSTQATEK